MKLQLFFGACPESSTINSQGRKTGFLGLLDVTVICLTIYQRQETEKIPGRVTGRERERESYRTRERESYRKRERELQEERKRDTGRESKKNTDRKRGRNPIPFHAPFVINQFLSLPPSFPYCLNFSLSLCLATKETPTFDRSDIKQFFDSTTTIRRGRENWERERELKEGEGKNSRRWVEGGKEVSEKRHVLIQSLASSSSWSQIYYTNSCL